MRWALHRSLTSISRALVCLTATLARGLDRRESSVICIESGVVGFTLIDVSELERSAIERYGSANVARSTVTDRRRYLRNARRSIDACSPKYYWVDPRSGSQQPVRAILQSLGLAVLLAWRRVTPVVWLTDAPHRRWRLQAEILTAGSGLILTLHPPKGFGVRFTHERVHGPLAMPMSQATMDRLAQAPGIETEGPPTAVFVGSLYEPRTSTIERVREALNRQGYVLEVHARAAEGPRIPDEEYWRRLSSAAVVYTTAAHAVEREADLVETPHLIYRYTEALAAGAPLVAPLVPGAEHLLEAGVHYADYGSEEEAVATIIRLLDDSSARQRLRDAGRRRIEQVNREQGVWQIIEGFGRP